MDPRATIRPVPRAVLRDRVVARGRVSGLDAVGFTDASPFVEARAVLEARKREGLNGAMEFTYRNPARSTDPGAVLSGARSIVAGARRYASEVPDAAGDGAPPVGDAVGATEPAAPMARVARYASVDHYAALREGLEAVADELRSAGHRAVVLADDNAMVDRSVAHRAGLGWFGKSSNLLLPGRGSWFVLGSVVTDADLTDPDDDAVAGPVADGCGTCRRCIDGCPTGAIVAEGVVDARRCLSWLLQQPGEFPRQFREVLGDRIYGCDDCQEVCPPNRRADGRGEGTAGEGELAGALVDVLRLLSADDREVMAVADAWYVPGREPDHVRRNALLVLGNTASPDDPRVVAALRRHLGADDELLVGHAAWAAAQLGRADLLDDPAWRDHPAVAAERP